MHSFQREIFGSMTKKLWKSADRAFHYCKWRVRSLSPNQALWPRRRDRTETCQKRAERRKAMETAVTVVLFATIVASEADRTPKGNGDTGQGTGVSAFSLGQKRAERRKAMGAVACSG